MNLSINDENKENKIRKWFGNYLRYWLKTKHLKKEVRKYLTRQQGERKAGLLLYNRSIWARFAYDLKNHSVQEISNKKTNLFQTTSNH